MSVFWLIIGMLLGGSVSVILTCCVMIARENDEEMESEYWYNRYGSLSDIHKDNFVLVDNAYQSLICGPDVDEAIKFLGQYIDERRV